MKLSHEQLSELLKSLPDPAFVLTRSGQYAALYGGSDSRYYHDGSSLVGLNLEDVLNRQKATWFLSEIEKALGSDKLHVVEYELSGKDVKGISDEGPQDAIWFEGRLTRLNFPVNGEDAVLWVASNITARHKLEEELRTLSETDALTGLWNRRHFQKAAVREQERALRYNNRVSLIMFDIDHFKLINDSRGHNTGDSVLKELSSVIAGTVRESDILSRWGGEEFSLLMPGIGLDSALEVAEKLRRLTEEHVFETGIRLTISVGGAEWLLKNESIDHLVSRTDEALYLAKHGGRNRIEAAPRGSAPDSPAESQQFPYFFEWRKGYESGNHQIDRQHKSLFDGTHELLRISAAFNASNSPESTFPEVLRHIDKLLTDLAEHFHDEEHLLSQIGWPRKDVHCSEHQLLFAHCQELRRSLAEKPSPDSFLRFVNYVVEDVIYGHTVKEDRDFFSSLPSSS